MGRSPTGQNGSASGGRGATGAQDSGALTSRRTGFRARDPPDPRHEKRDARRADARGEGAMCYRKEEAQGSE
eukprot:scaffold4574_cov143-Isochrysis_galbana.AAC.6